MVNMDPLAMELVCKFLIEDEPNLWKQDVQELAAFAKTCKQASEACGPLVKKYQILEHMFFPGRVGLEEEFAKFDIIMKPYRKKMKQDMRQAHQERMRERSV